MQLARIPGKVRYTFPGQSEQVLEFTSKPPEVKTEEVQTISNPIMYEWKMWQMNPGETQYYWRGSATSTQQPRRVAWGFESCSCSGQWLGGILLRADAAAYVELWRQLSVCADTIIDTRCDLLLGGDRLMGRSKQPCPTWKIEPSKCPEGSLDCGDCCLDCASVKAAVEGITGAALPISIWRPKQ